MWEFVLNPNPTDIINMNVWMFVYQTRINLIKMELSMEIIYMYPQRNFEIKIGSKPF